MTAATRHCTAYSVRCGGCLYYPCFTDEVMRPRWSCDLLQVTELACQGARIQTWAARPYGTFVLLPPDGKGWEAEGKPWGL